jgi:hypothetical protein
MTSTHSKQDYIAKNEAITVDSRRRTNRQQPFAAMGADLVKSSAVLISKFVLG